MFKWRVYAALVVIFNVLMIVAFIFSNIYIWNFINKLTSQASYSSNGVRIPQIQIDALQVTGWLNGWDSDGIAVPTPFPTSIPNYPFNLFWVAMLGNIAFAVFILRSRKAS